MAATQPITPVTPPSPATPTALARPAAFGPQTFGPPAATQPTQPTMPAPARPAFPQPTAAYAYQPVAEREPWWERDGVVSRILALGGVAITLIGIVMLLVLAARAGLLRPEIRVGLGGLLAVALVGAGLHVQSRPGGRVGGIALVATGIVAGFLDVLAMTSLYGWVNVPVGLVLATLVAVAGVVIARRWTSPQLMIITQVAAVLTAPIITSGVTRTLVVFYLLLQITGAILELLDGWSVLAPVRTVPVVFAAMILQAIDLSRGGLDVGWISPANWNLIMGIAILVVGVGAATLRHGVQRIPALAALTAGLSALPVLVALVGSTRPVAIGVGLALTAALLGARAAAPVASAIRTADEAVAGIILAIVCVAARPDDPTLFALPFLAVAIVTMALALQVRAVFIRAYAAAFAGFAALIVLATISPAMLARGTYALDALTYGSALAGLLLMVLSVLAVAVLWVTGPAQRMHWLLIAPVFFALYGVTAICVAVPVGITGDLSGFHVGHLIATLTWALTGAGILAFGLARPSWARLCLAIGLTLIAAAVAKLLTYDLASLTGLTRAVAFLGIGLLLLIAGTRYARVFADRHEPPAPGPGAGGPPPTYPHGGVPGPAPQPPAGPAAGAAHPGSTG